MPPPSIFHRSSKGANRPTVPFDSDVPAGVDPEGAWRLANSGKGNRKGTTSAQRAGMDPGYTPGYGRSAAGNRPYGFSSNWAEMFKPQIQIPKVGQEMAGGQVLPPAANAPAQAATPPPPPPAATPPPAGSFRQVSSGDFADRPGSNGFAGEPIPGTQASMRVSNYPEVSLREITGLPKGNEARSSFIPGQNSPANLAKRKRAPIDPLA